MPNAYPTRSLFLAHPALHIPRAASLPRHALALAAAALLCGPAWADGAGGAGNVGYPSSASGGAGNGGGTVGDGGNGTYADPGVPGNAGSTPDATGGSGGVYTNNAGEDASGGAGGAAVVYPGSGTLNVSSPASLVGGGGGGGGSSLTSGSDLAAPARGGDGGSGVVLSGLNASLVNAGRISGGGGGGGGLSLQWSAGDASDTTGGAGGTGVVMAADGASVVNSGFIYGGAGGGGGLSEAFGQPGNADGGAGGTGVSMAGTGQTLTNTGTISGGNGGGGGTPVSFSMLLPGSSGGAGGAGVTLGGAGNTLINAGTISGGLDAAAARAPAVLVTGTGNTVELQAGYAFVGEVVGSAGNTLRLGGVADASFDLGAIATGSPTAYDAGVGARYWNFSSFAKTGASVWTLGGSTASNVAWAVDAGELRVNGSMANAAVSLTGSSSLSGTGTVGAVTLGSGTTLLAPTVGNGLHVNGTLHFQAGSTYAVSVDTSGGAGVTAVTGNLGIDSGAALVLTGPAGTYSAATPYTLITHTGSRTGTFSTVDFNFAYVTPTVSYGANAVTLTLQSAPVFTASGFGSVAATGNQRSVGTALDRINDAGGNEVTNTLLTASTDEARRGLANLSGDSVTAFGTLAVSQMRGAMDAIGQRLASIGAPANTGSVRGPSSEAVAAAASPTDDDPWVSLTYASARHDADTVSGASAFKNRAVSLAFGHDRRIDERWLAGFALQASNDDIDYSTATASGRSNGLQAALYAHYRPVDSALFFKGIASLGRWNNALDRSVNIGLLSGQTRGRFDTQGAALYGEIGTTLQQASLAVEPYAGVMASRTRRGGYTESVTSGSGAVALSFAPQTDTYSALTLGTRLKQTGDLDGRPLTWQADLAWRHRLSSATQSATAAFASVPGSDFTVQAQGQPRDEAVLRLGASYAINRMVSAYAELGASAGAHQRAYGATAGVRWFW